MQSRKADKDIFGVSRMINQEKKFLNSDSVCKGGGDCQPELTLISLFSLGHPSARPPEQ